MIVNRGIGCLYSIPPEYVHPTCWSHWQSAPTPLHHHGVVAGSPPTTSAGVRDPVEALATPASHHRRFMPYPA